MKEIKEDGIKDIPCLCILKLILLKCWYYTKLPVEGLVAQLCLTLCNLMDFSLPSFSVHGIFQARILESIAIPFSRGSSWPTDQHRSPTLQADSLPSEPPGKPKATCKFVVILIKMSKVCSHKYKNPKICMESSKISNN